MVFSFKDYDDSQKYIYNIFNLIFGGDVYSKLFVNVREKESLCYYVNSSLDLTNHLLFIRSGIDSENIDKTKTLINQLLFGLADDEISHELAMAKITIANNFKKIKDHRSIYADFTFEKELLAETTDFDYYLNIYEQITANDIKKIIRNFSLVGTHILK